MKVLSLERKQIMLVIVVLGAYVTVAYQHKIHAQEQATQVTVGGSKRLAACPERAIIERRGYTALMTQPNRAARVKTNLMSGAQLFVCERQGEWLGVVVAAVEPVQCGVSVSIERREPYRGGCASGWVLRDNVIVQVPAVRE
jgi:hypothetical protein